MNQASPSNDVTRIQKMISEVQGQSSLNAKKREEFLQTFGEYECWAPYFRMVKQNLADPSTRTIEDYIRLGKVQNLYLEDVFAATETCTALVNDLKITFQVLCLNVLPDVVAVDDFVAEATILQGVCDHLVEKNDQVSCLERLCMLYEKKTHNDTQLTMTYEKLLQTDPYNVKALRYFKLMFTQEHDWEEVVAILKTLMQSVTRSQELFRVAQELAGIYLYQMDNPAEAISTVERHCLESPLDTSNILYDAYHRLADWQGCLNVLRENLLIVEDAPQAAILHFKIAKMFEKTGDKKSAVEHFGKSVKLWPQFLDPIEGIINQYIEASDWDSIVQWLNLLINQVNDDALIGQLQQARKRLFDGIQHAKQR